jgi:hypothetical protein
LLPWLLRIGLSALTTTSAAPTAAAASAPAASLVLAFTRCGGIRWWRCLHGPALLGVLARLVALIASLLPLATMAIVAPEIRPSVAI